jgi:aliphatic aldoxime dehydratase
VSDVKERPAVNARTGQCPVRRFPLNQPDGHKAPVPRYSADVKARVAVLFLGLQAKSDALPDAGLSEFLARISKESAAPVYVDQAAYTDLQGYLNRVAALYWLDTAQFAAWLDTPAVKDWRARMCADTSVGLWWEPVVVDARQMETITFKEFRRGFSGCPAMGLNSTDHTGYWGAARDRIPRSADDLFEATVAAGERCPVTGAENRASYRKIQPPQNMCVIRPGVSWEKCDGEQLKDWRERIKPKLDAGMKYLRDNPGATGCFSLRQVESISAGGEKLAEAYSLGAFASLKHLEAWSKDHPSHLAIYTSALAARKKYQEKLELHTYNEIFILEADNPPFEYFNCHPQTGLLPFAEQLAAAKS